MCFEQDLRRRASSKVSTSEPLIFLIKILTTFALSEVEVPRKSGQNKLNVNKKEKLYISNYKCTDSSVY